jgi:histidinol-phosphate/aromatic aminotransferase/cobyric acid decarboxylase-like protein
MISRKLIVLTTIRVLCLDALPPNYSEALKQNKVEVRRFFPAMPNFMRVTIGTKADMQTFIKVFHQVMVSNASG